MVNQHHSSELDDSVIAFLSFEQSEADEKDCASK